MVGHGPAGAERRPELHDVDHLRRAVRHRRERVLVPPPREGAALLLVDEPVRVLVPRDRTGHPERDAKWRARQVTVSPSFMTPLVTLPSARSPDALIEAVWASTDSDRSKQSATGATITVSSRREGTLSAKRTARAANRACAATQRWADGTRTPHYRRQKRTFTPVAAMHKHTARPTVRRAVTGDCYTAIDAKSS
jgi:hypothetical protein